jgi:hypothetical protein
MQMYWKYGTLIFGAESKEEWDRLNEFEKNNRADFNERDDATRWDSDEGVSPFQPRYFYSGGKFVESGTKYLNPELTRMLS